MTHRVEDRSSVSNRSGGAGRSAGESTVTEFVEGLRRASGGRRIDESALASVGLREHDLRAMSDLHPDEVHDAIREAGGSREEQDQAYALLDRSVRAQVRHLVA